MVMLTWLGLGILFPWWVVKHRIKVTLEELLTQVVKAKLFLTHSGVLWPTVQYRKKKRLYHKILVILDKLLNPLF